MRTLYSRKVSIAGQRIVFEWYAKLPSVRHATSARNVTRSGSPQAQNPVTRLALFLMFFLLVRWLGLAQSSLQPSSYAIPNTGGISQWVRLGTLQAPQLGAVADVSIIANNGYNASFYQNTEIHIRFTTSNASSTDANGFAGDSTFYTVGYSGLSASSVKWVANAAGGSASSFTLYVYLPNYTGTSFYTISTSGVWTANIATNQPDPGVASSSVDVATPEFVLNEGSIYVDPSGDVGIGTSDTQQDLSVAGWVNIDQSGNNNGSNGVSLSFGSNSGEGIGSSRVSGTPDAFGLNFYTAFGKRMTITNAGNIGIGTMTPQATLEVNGSTLIDGSLTTQSITFANGSSMSTAPPANLTSSATGSIGIGTVKPVVALDVGPLSGGGPQSSSAGAAGLIRNNAPADLNPYTQARLIVYGGPGVDTGNWGYFAYGADASLREVYAKTGAGAPLLWGTSSAMDGTGTFSSTMALTPSGSLGLGVTNPGTDLNQQQQTGPVLEVVGNIAFKQGAPGVGTGAGIIFSDGTSQTTAYQGTSCPIADVVMPDKTIVAQGGDYAEAVDVNGDRATYEPGDVMVIDPANPEHFLKSSKPYSTLVAGIYSTKPGYVGRRQLGDPKLAKTEIPMAMIGIVPTKVTTENGPIKVGDLLVTSSTSGYAMKGTKRKAMSGAIVGKALSKLDVGTGVIEVLVSLQ